MTTEAFVALVEVAPLQQVVVGRLDSRVRST
jgi:hypothetical protein